MAFTFPSSPTTGDVYGHYTWSGYAWRASSGGGGGGVTTHASVVDVISVSGSELGAVDAGSDNLVFWDDSTSKLRYLTLDSSSLTITDTTISASGGGGGGSSVDPLETIIFG